MFKSLSSRLIAYFILLVFIPTIAGGVIILIQTNSSQKKQAGQLQKQVSKRIASELNNYVESNKDYILQTLNILDFFSGDKNINDKTLDIFNYKNTFEEIAYTDKNGKEVAKYHRYKVFYEHEKQDLSSDISFLFPKINDKVYYSSAAFDNSSGEPLLKISIPVHNPYSGEFSGVFIASLRLKPIWNLLREADTLPGQTVYILDSKNRVIAHPNPSIALKNTYYMLSDNHIANGISGKKSIIESTKVNFGNQILTVVAEQDLKYAMELSYKNRTVIVAAVSASMIMIAVLILTLIKHLVAPVENMVKVSKDIAKGDFSKKAIVYRNDELGHLAESFNSMTQKLQDNNEQLAQFNIGLQNKIKEEIEKTRHVEQILYEQKKFADMGQMMNAIAHQWRQPLNNIGLMTQYLYDAYVCNEINQKEYKRISDDLLTIVQEMSNTIDDFRNFFSGNKESTDFNVIMTILTFLRLIDAQLNNSKVQVEVTCNCDGEEKTFKAHQRSEVCKNDDFVITGPPGEFKQVIQNILENAKDALVENKKTDRIIHISVITIADEVRISIADNAGGIPEENLNMIFNPYFTTKDEGKGTGIGLYISKLIIDDHFKGLLTAHNNMEGAVFDIIIPKSGGKTLIKPPA